MLASGDDGIHSDTLLDINGGNIDISKSYEGIESSTININDGNIRLVASDDGLNAAGGNDGSSTNGRPGQNGFSSSTGVINITGGYLYVDAAGDGVDSNGSIEMSGGTVIVNGPENSGNGALDYDTTFNITGGTFIAAGSSGMAQSPSSSSTQASINIFTNGIANTLVNVTDEPGNEIITFAPSKTFSSIIISTPELQTGNTYTVSTGGNYSLEDIDGLYENGNYSGGSKLTNFTLSSSVMSVTSSGASEGGSMNGGMPGGGGMGGNRTPRP
nr:carbohydrate-binding domain-containing protein [Clostridium disporicum]